MAVFSFLVQMLFQLFDCFNMTKSQYVDNLSNRDFLHKFQLFSPEFLGWRETCRMVTTLQFQENQESVSEYYEVRESRIHSLQFILPFYRKRLGVCFLCCFREEYLLCSHICRNNHCWDTFSWFTRFAHVWRCYQEVIPNQDIRTLTASQPDCFI